VHEQKQEARPLQSVTCPKCGHDRAYFHLMQTRRSDEPPTQINECAKCGHSWRDYQ
jgi:DNA-directed RNA polymerase subunit M